MKFISIVPPLLLFLACAPKAKPTASVVAPAVAKPQNNPFDTILMYKSANNGSAEIKLAMLENHTFDFQLQTLPPTDAQAINAKLGGVWKQEQEHKRLIFSKQQIPLKVLFDSATSAQNRQFTVVNDSIVDIMDQGQGHGIFIGGILCERKVLVK